MSSPSDNKRYNRGGANKQTSKEPQCTQSGGDRHQPGARCPALGATFRKCQKKGHFSAQCFSKPIATVSATTEEMGDQPSFLGAVSGGAEDSWLVDIRIKKQTVSFKMDTGAEVTTVSGDTYQSLGELRLRKPTMVLYGPAHQPIRCDGSVYRMA